MKYFVAACWLLTAGSAVSAALFFLMFGLSGMSAEKTAAVGIASLCIAGIPYVLTKAIEGIWKL